MEKSVKIGLQVGQQQALDVRGLESDAEREVSSILSQYSLSVFSLSILSQYSLSAEPVKSGRFTGCSDGEASLDEDWIVRREGGSLNMKQEAERI